MALVDVGGEAEEARAPPTRGLPCKRAAVEAISPLLQVAPPIRGGDVVDAEHRGRR